MADRARVSSAGMLMAPVPSLSPGAQPISAPRLREGELFDHTYRLIRLLGEGAMCAVHEATHARMEGRYAIKVLLLKPTLGSEAVALFAREARITSLLQHPNIFQVAKVQHVGLAPGSGHFTRGCGKHPRRSDRFVLVH